MNFYCDVYKCNNLAVFVYIGESGDFYLCDIHSLAKDTCGWKRIETNDT